MYENLDSRVRAASKLSEPLRQFARNGRWGSCQLCPKDSSGSEYPEFCVHTADDAHQRDGELLLRWFNVVLAQFEEERGMLE